MWKSQKVETVLSTVSRCEASQAFAGVNKAGYGATGMRVSSGKEHLTFSIHSGKGLKRCCRNASRRCGAPSLRLGMGRNRILPFSLKPDLHPSPLLSITAIRELERAL